MTVMIMYTDAREVSYVEEFAQDDGSAVFNVMKARLTPIRFNVGDFEDILTWTAATLGRENTDGLDDAIAVAINEKQELAAVLVFRPSAL